LNIHLHLTRFTRYVLFAALVAIALASATVRFILLPHAAQFRQQLESLISSATNEQVSIGHLAARISGFYPELVLQDISIADAEGLRPPLRLERLAVAFDPVRSLINRRPMLAGIGLSGTRITLQKTAQGNWKLLGLRTSEGKPGWLFNTDRIWLSDIALTLEDTAAPTESWTVAVTGDLQNQGSRHQLNGEIGLPGSLGKSLSVAADIEFADGAGEPASVNGTVYAEGILIQALPLKRLFNLPVEQQSGTTSFRLWSQLDRGAPTRATAWLDSAHPRFTYHLADDSRGHLEVDRIAGWLQWLPTDEGWRLDGNHVELRIGGHPWKPMRFALSASRNLGALGFAGNYLRLDDLLGIADALGVIPQAQLERLRSAGLSGEFEDFRGIWSNTPESHWGFAGNASNIHVNPIGHIPGISGFHGNVRGSDRNGRLLFRIAEGIFKAPEVFKTPLSISEATGLLSWTALPDGLSVSAVNLELHNADVSAQGRLALFLPTAQGSSPFIDLRANLGPMTLPGLKAYLPHGVIPITSAWLNESLLEGRANSTHLLLSGPLHAFPFDNNEGTFEIFVDVTDIGLKFARDWPPLKQVDAKLEFISSSMSISASTGHIGDGRLQWAEAFVPNLHREPWLSIQGQVGAAIPAAMNFLAASPLSHIPSRLNKYATTSGNATISLDLNLPLKPDLGQPEVSGKAELKNAAIKVLKLDQPVTDINGDLLFTQEDLNADDVKARFLDTDARLGVRSDRDEIRVSMTSGIGTDKLQKFVAPERIRRLSGTFDYRLDLALPKTDDESKPFRASLSSNLSGLGVELPSPLGKSATEVRFLHADLTAPSADQSRVHVSYGSLDADLELTGTALERGAIALGTSLPALPEKKGLNLAITQPDLDLSAWHEVLTTEVSSSTAGPVLNQAAVVLDRPSWRGRDLGHLRVQAHREQQSWTGHIDSPYASGTFQHRTDAKGPAMLELELDRLAIPKGQTAATESESDIRPANLPSLKISSKQFSWHDIELGQLRLQTSPLPTGLAINTLSLRRNADSLKLKGSWLQSREGSETKIRGITQCENLGDLLATFGYAREIRETPARFAFDLGWKNSPGNFSLGSTHGTVKLDLGRGGILNVDPGLGRALGVLNLGTLRRLLLLDFKDLFGKGMAYDSMKGVFRLGNGQATTEAFFIDSVAAKIFITGRVGLVAKDLDETVVVIPHTLATLPVAGALMGGAAVGMAYNFAQTLMGNRTVSIASTNYEIKGSWDDPKIARIEGNLPLEVIDRAWSDVKDLSGFGTDGEDKLDE
jgi:uncharacterized protein (TIGR02099 family)